MTTEPAPEYPHTRTLARIEIVEEVNAAGGVVHRIDSTVDWVTAKADVVTVSVLLDQYSRLLADNYLTAYVVRTELEPVSEATEAEVAAEPALPQRTWKDDFGIGDAAG